MEEGSDFTSFRPYEEKDLIPTPKGKNNIEINVGNTRIVFQKTPPPSKRNVASTQPKKIPRVDSYSNQRSVSSLSQASAVGMTTGSLKRVQQSHLSVVENQLGMTIPKPSSDKHWMPDKLCHQCSECEVKFSMFVRRHHCRICGRIFCHSCTNYSIQGSSLHPPLAGRVRVCKACLDIFCNMNTGIAGSANSSSNTNPSSDLNPAVTVSTLPIRGRSNSFSSEQQGSPELESVSTLSFNPSMVQNRVSWDDCTLPDAEMISSPSRLSNVGVEFDNPTPLRYATRRQRNRNSKDDSVLALTEDEIDVRLQEIWSKFTDKTQGMAPQSKRHRFGIRTFQNAYVAQEIVEWLIANDHAYSREMAIRIGQTFIDTKYLNVVSSTDQVFRDSKDLILELGESGTLSPLATSPTIMDAPNWFLSEDESTGLESRASVHEANIDIESTPVTFHQQNQPNVVVPQFRSDLSPPEVVCIDEVEEPQDENMEKSVKEASKPSETTHFVQNYFSKDGVVPSKESFLIPPTTGENETPNIVSYSVLTPGSVLQAFPLTQTSHFAHESESTSVRSEIKQEHTLHHQSHLELFLIQQLIFFGISMSWLEIIQPLILEASHKVRTHVLPEDFMDIESYCKVKKIPGGRKHSCSFIHGAVFSKHVSHKKMDLSLRNPRILLLKCALEFQRKENQLSSFDTLMLQEQEYLKNLVERVKTFRPSIVLVQKSVARFALEMFHHHGVVVVVNVKPSVMARVARSCQGDLLSNLDQLYFNVKLGTCGHFYVRTFTLPDGVRKTLMYFDECEPILGGVILLQGGDNRELKKVKKVVQFGLQIAHNMRLESAFLTDEFAVPKCGVHIPNDMAQGYITPPSSPELYLYPFSNSIFDEPVVESPIEVKICEDKESVASDSTIYEEAVTTVTGNTLPQSSEDAERGKEEEVEVCPLPQPLVQEEDVTEEQVHVSEPPQQDEEHKGEDGSEVTSKPCLSSELVFKQVLQSRLISTSPHVCFTVPYLQTEQGIAADSKKYLPDVVYWSHWFKPCTLNDGESTDYHNSSIMFSLSTRLRAASRSYMENDGAPRKHNYKSVSSHPFVSSTFVSSVNDNGVKAALADFRARASHPDEPNCYFFPSARKATDVTTQLQNIFAKSKEFEDKANRYHQLHMQRTSDEEAKEEPLADQEPRLSGPVTRTTRWIVPEKELLRPSTPVKKQEQVTIVTADQPDGFQDEPEKNQTNDLTQVFEGKCVRASPEPMVLSSADNNPNLISSDKDWATITDEQLDCLDPFNHQSISLVFSSTCHDKMKHLYPCVPPCIIPMSYYGRNDIPLGEFLHRYCFREEYICQSCNVDMSSHQRHFVHGRTELRISMQQLGASIPGGDKRIFTWCVCTQCSKQSTPLVPLSEDALLFSFAKFLELKFYGTEYTCYNFQDKLPPTCTHPVHSYMQFFSLQDKVATFELFPVNLFELRVPPQEIQLDALQVVHHDYLTEISRLSKLIESVFYHIKQYVELYNVHVEPVQEMMKNCMDRCLGLRETLRLKVKRIKELSAKLGIHTEGVTLKELREDYFLLQDSIAELKRNLAESVDWCNKDLNEVDSKLREWVNKKDPSPRDTPLSTALESDSPKLSPRIQHRNSENGLRTTPTINTSYSKKTLTQSGDEATDDGKKSKLQVPRHRRQLSDSITLQKITDTDTSNDNTSRDRIKSDGQLLPIDSKLPTHPMSEPGSPTRSHDSDTEEGGELVSALKESMTSAEVMSVVYAEDIMAKIRGKDIDDPARFYYLRSTPISTTSLDNSEGKSSTATSNKKFPASPKVDETDTGSGNGLKSKITSEKLINLLSKPFQKLPSPFEATEHHLLRGKLRFQISVYENEPTSIIAFTLCSREYAQELKLLVDEARRMGLTESVISVNTRGNSEGDIQAGAKTSGFIKNVISEIRKKKLQSSTSIANVPADELPSVDQSDIFDESASHNTSPIKWNSLQDTSDKFSSSHENKHISLEFSDDTTKFFCKVYYAEEFRRLRESLHLEGDDSYIRSLARCVRYEAKGGKSKSMFLKTFEDRLIMKQVQLVEITSFIEIAPQYFQHVYDAIRKKRPQVLAKILGAYSIGFRNSKTGRSKRHNVIIMENLLFSHKCSKVFDLKGSMRGRYVTQDPKKDGKGDVLMDENFLEYVYNNPVYVWPHTKAVLMQAIIADTEFLANNSIMDYSLLTGLDEEKGELVVGIIDFVRPFTLDKRLEMIVKKAGRSVLPTVVYPDLYRKRFIDAMDRYFSPIPDKWTGLGADIRVSF